MPPCPQDHPNKLEGFLRKLLPTGKNLDVNRVESLPPHYKVKPTLETPWYPAPVLQEDSKR